MQNSKKYSYQYKTLETIKSIKQNYLVLDNIGKGSYGEVYKCKIVDLKKNNKDQDQEQIVAVKVINKKIMEHDPEEYVYLKREIQTLQQCNSEKILRFIDSSEDNKNNYLIVTEYCNQGSLYDYLKKNGNKQMINPYLTTYYLNEEIALTYLKKVLECFFYLHNFQKDKVVVHRDIKLENILVHNDNFKLGDVGFCIELNKYNSLESNIGSPKTKAPEISKGKKYDSKVDVYSLGVMLYQMMFGIFPFSKKRSSQNADLCKLGKIDLEKYGIQISEYSKNLILKMTKYDSKDRLSFKQLFKEFNIQQQELLQTPFQQNIQNNQEMQKVNIKLLGSQQSGKNTLLQKYIRCLYLKDQKSKLYFSTTSGQEKFNSLPKQELRANGFFILINLSKDENPTEIIKQWVEKIYEVNGISQEINNRIQIILTCDELQSEIQNINFINIQKNILQQYCENRLNLNCSIVSLENNQDEFKQFLIQYLNRNQKYISSIESNSNGSSVLSDKQSNINKQSKLKLSKNSNCCI